MMTSNRLFIERLKESLRYQYQIYKVVLDWTILVYLVLPTAVISGFIYYSWWEAGPRWLQYVSLELFLNLFFFLTLIGHFRTYIKAADSIFLMKNRRLQLRLKQKAIIYSAMKQFLIASILVGAIAPFWLMYFEKTVAHLLYFMCFWVTFKWAFMAVKGELERIEKGWKSYVVTASLFILSLILWNVCMHVYERPILLLITIVVHLSITVFCLRRRFTQTSTFMQDVAIEETEKTKITTFIFTMADGIEKPERPLSNRKRPRLFSSSGRIFKKRTAVNGYVELFMKICVRKVSFIMGTFQIIGWTSAVILLVPPIWIKLLFAVLGYIFLQIWFHSLWEKLIGEHPFTKRFKQNIAYTKARSRVMLVLSLPYFLMISSTLYYIFG